MPDPYDPGRVAADLARCRQRGLEGLDRDTVNQKPVDASELQRLAAVYAAATPSKDPRRIAQIKVLMLAGIDELKRHDRHSEADLIRDLFFGESKDGLIRPPGYLLKIARRKANDMADSRFDQWRSSALRSFADVLIEYVTELTPAPPGPDVQESHGVMATIGRAGDTHHFVQLLAAAEKVTIVGITNEDLLPMLQEALNVKRQASGRAEAFWDSIRIVFQSMDLLNTVSDERLRLSDPPEALRQRTVAAYWARRQIEVFLKRSGSVKWEMCESNYQPVLTGTFLEFADGSKMAHLLFRRPLHSREEQTYLDIPDPRGEIREVFEEVVYTSKPARMVVPTGEPLADGSFRCYGSQVQSDVLQDRSRASGWLPMILVVTYRRYRGHVEPILQLRTPENSAREENRLAHIAGHIEKDDRRSPGGRNLADPPAIFNLADGVPVSAAQQLVRHMTGAEPAQLEPVTASGYLYPDKESLFFFVYALSLPEGLQFPRPAEMLPFELHRQLAVRANQSFRAAADLCRNSDTSASGWPVAVRIAGLNLRLHDRADLAERLAATGHRAAAERADLAHVLDGLVQNMTAPSRASISREVTIEGLAGWQYRHFFSDLLPLYRRIGVDGAAELLQSVTTDPTKDAAWRELAAIYQDEQQIAALSMEL